MNLDFSATIPQIPFILEGLAVTLKIVLVSAVIGLVLGIVLSLFKISTISPLKWIADFYTSIFRGTPLVLQLMIIYFGMPQLLGFQIDQFWAAVTALSL
ncbi:ABC transporter permease subunit, partial [Bacillus velezensis]